MLTQSYEVPYILNSVSYPKVEEFKLNGLEYAVAELSSALSSEDDSEENYN